MSERLELTLRNDLSELTRLATELEAFGERVGMDMEVLFKLNLVLDELFTNVVHYAYPQGGEHPFSVALWTADDHLWVELVDDGVPFNPLELPPPDLQADVAAREVGGLGVHFARRLMDDVHYVRENGRNRLLLGRRLADSSRG